jgi:hypothetical protein
MYGVNLNSAAGNAAAWEVRVTAGIREMVPYVPITPPSPAPSGWNPAWNLSSPMPAAGMTVFYIDVPGGVSADQTLLLNHLLNWTLTGRPNTVSHGPPTPAGVTFASYGVLLTSN